MKREITRKKVIALAVVTITLLCSLIFANTAISEVQAASKKYTKTYSLKRNYKKIVKLKSKIKSVKSSNNKVATVKKSGKKFTITTKKKGTTAITVKCVNKKTYKYKVKVSNKKHTYGYTKIYKTERNHIKSVKLKSKIKSVKSSNEEVAKVIRYEKEFTIIAKKKGTTIITAKCKNKKTYRYKVIVSKEKYPSELKRTLIIDPMIVPDIRTNNGPDTGAYVLERINDPGLCATYSTTGKVLKNAIGYSGVLIDNNCFETSEGEIISLDDLEWYCIHNPTEISTQEDESCTCNEFIAKQYGVIYLGETIKYSRCKHANTVVWNPANVPQIFALRTIGYEICNDCDAILDVCPHTNRNVEEPRYSEVSWSSTGVVKSSSVYCGDCEAVCPSIIEEIQPCAHDNVRIKVTTNHDGDTEIVWCDDCDCVVSNSPEYYDFGQ